MDKFTSSVVSYKDRGKWGNSSYRGNTTGHIIYQFLETYHTNPYGLFVDPMEGGGTSKDVAKELGIQYCGFDLKRGFNILTDSLLARLPKPAHAIFVHPPYMNMIRYEAGPGDLSEVRNFSEFLEKCQLALMNVYEALEPGGHYAVLMGNMRREGKFYPIASRLAVFSPGEQVMEIIKEQNNMRSSGTPYKNYNFVPTTHEMLTIFRKPENLLFTLDVVMQKDTVVAALGEGSWRNLVRQAMMEKEVVTLAEIYEFVERSPRAKTNAHWREKVRQVVRMYEEFENVARGQYTLAFN